MKMNREALVRWVSGHRAAAARADELRRMAMSPQEAFVAAMELWDLNPALFDAPEDRVRIEEVRSARASWARLRERLG